MMRRLLVVGAVVGLASVVASQQPPTKLGGDTVVVLRVREQMHQTNGVKLTTPTGASVLVQEVDIDQELTLAARQNDARRERGLPLLVGPRPPADRPAPASSASPSDATAMIEAKCAKDWPDDFKMQGFCREQQQAALSALGQRRMDGANEATIRAKCVRDWPTDFKMRDFCETQQLDALKKLR